MSDQIPFEVQTEIIKRFPVKSLMQSRSLSKTFKSLIDSPQFIADYNACESRPPHLLLRYDDPLALKEHYYQFLSITDDNCFPQHLPHLLLKCFIIGNSDGLLCFYGYDKTRGGEFPVDIEELVVIWNPSLQKHIVVDVPVLYDIYLCIIGFGVHPKTNDPMLVKIVDVNYQRFVEVFSLTSRVWRSPRGNEPRKSISFQWSQVAMDGFIYWFAVDTKQGLYGFRDSTYNLIMSFDMTSEEFAETNLPDCLVSCDKILYISKLRESLVVFEGYSDVEEPVCDIWKMNHGVTKSFTKLFTVNLPFSPLKTILGFRKNNEPILGKLMDDREESTKLEVYDTSVEEVKNLAMNGQLGSFFVSAYKETLLLHDQKNLDFIPISVN